MEPYVEPYEMDFAEYIASRGGLYLPFPNAVELVYFWDWARSMWGALRNSIRPPASRIVELLQRQERIGAYLPPEIAQDYPTVANPFA